MNTYEIVKLREHPDLRDQAAGWFHDRKDLAPNVCAVYVEEDCRCQGLAGSLLRFACRDMAARGISTLYLITDHTSFYERYGWEFLCMVRGDGEEELSRMYVHREETL